MHPQLVLGLVEKGAIRHGTIIDARFSAKDLSCHTAATIVGRFIVHRVCRRSDGTIFFITERDGERRRIETDAVQAVDGMAVSRFAQNYDLTLDGAPIPQKGRRGRKRASAQSAEAMVGR